MDNAVVTSCVALTREECENFPYTWMWSHVSGKCSSAGDCSRQTQFTPSVCSVATGIHTRVRVCDTGGFLAVGRGGRAKGDHPQELSCRQRRARRERRGRLARRSGDVVARSGFGSRADLHDRGPPLSRPVLVPQLRRAFRMAVRPSELPPAAYPAPDDGANLSPVVRRGGAA